MKRISDKPTTDSDNAWILFKVLKSTDLMSNSRILANKFEEDWQISERKHSFSFYIFLACVAFDRFWKDNVANALKIQAQIDWNVGSHGFDKKGVRNVYFKCMLFTHHVNLRPLEVFFVCFTKSHNHFHHQKNVVLTMSWSILWVCLNCWRAESSWNLHTP